MNEDEQVQKAGEVWVEGMFDRDYAPKVWGEEAIITNNHLYCGKILRVFEGWVSSLHYHKEKMETFLVLDGVVGIEVWDTPEDLESGEKGRLFVLRGPLEEAIHLPPKTPHRFWAVKGPAFVVEFSTPHKEEDVVRVEKSQSVKQLAEKGRESLDEKEEEKKND